MGKKIIYLFIAVSPFLFADKIDEMRKELKEVENTITENRKRVSEVQKQEQETLAKINKIEIELNRIQREYQQTSQKYVEITRNIDYAKGNLEFAVDEIENRKEELKKKILKWRKYKKNEIEYRLDGDSLFEILRKKRNLKKIMEHEKKELNRIYEVRNNIKREAETIRDTSKKVKQLNDKLANQKRLMSKNIREKNRLINQLYDKKKYYKTSINELAKKQEDIQNRITQIIQARTEKEDQNNMSDIRAKLGTLDYPLDGKILLSFNEKQDMGYNETIKSTGLEIEGRLGSRIKTVADGEVIYVGELPGLNKVIMVSHGYGLVTVYGNLISTYVTLEEELKKNQNIGVLGVSKKFQKSVLHFELRLNSKPIDPFILLEG
ncbi:MAG: murein hydrolase activator EnvC family protein [Fusobacteriota bacterium]